MHDHLFAVIGRHPGDAHDLGDAARARFVRLNRVDYSLSQEGQGLEPIQGRAACAGSMSAGCSARHSSMAISLSNTPDTRTVLNPVIFILLPQPSRCSRTLPDAATHVLSALPLFCVHPYDSSDFVLSPERV
jgi:hypothetical protein